MWPVVVTHCGRCSGNVFIIIFQSKHCYSESSSKGTEIVPVKTTVEIDASVPARSIRFRTFFSHSRSIEAAAREPTYLSYQCVLPLVRLILGGVAL